ncbi:MAG: TolC family protein [Endomicrobium sp.]|jgi:outer membrane protein TolC|nr:TolC family protein [Endomicrobium sp.]
MRKVLIAFLFLLTTNPCGLLAEKITAELVEAQTLENNPSIKQAKYNLYMAEQELYSSFSAFLPNVEFFGTLAPGLDKGFYQTYNMFGQEVTDKKLGDQRYTYGLNGHLSLFSGFADYNNTRSLSAKAKTAKEAYTRSVSDAVLNAQSAYVNLMYTYESISLYKQIKKRKKENVDLIKLRYHSGSADLGSLRRVESDVKSFEYELEKAQRAIETVSAALLIAIGRNDEMTILETDEKIGSGIDIDGDGIGDSFNDEIISRPDFGNLITKTPEFLSAKYNFAAAKALNWAQKGQWLPSLAIEGNINHQRYDQAWNPENKSWAVQLNLRYPLFTGGKRWFGTRSALAQEKKAAENFRYMQNTLKVKAVQYYTDWVNSYEYIEVIKYILECSKLQLEIAKQKYINGLISYEDWYSIDTQYTDAQRHMLTARQKALTSRIEWRKFLGKVSMRDKEDKNEK